LKLACAIGQAAGAPSAPPNTVLPLRASTTLKREAGTSGTAAHLAAPGRKPIWLSWISRSPRGKAAAPMAVAGTRHEATAAAIASAQPKEAVRIAQATSKLALPEAGCTGLRRPSTSMHQSCSEPSVTLAV
jgi:hypothetical protein